MQNKKYFSGTSSFLAHRIRFVEGSTNRIHADEVKKEEVFVRWGGLTLQVLHSNSSTADGSYDAKNPNPALLDYTTAPASWPEAL